MHVQTDAEQKTTQKYVSVKNFWLRP